jgi:hypothetical protein
MGGALPCGLAGVLTVFHCKKTSMWSKCHNNPQIWTGSLSCSRRKDVRFGIWNIMSFYSSVIKISAEE